jgi:hypothetical protein
MRQLVWATFIAAVCAAALAPALPAAPKDHDERPAGRGQDERRTGPPAHANGHAHGQGGRQQAEGKRAAHSTPPGHARGHARRARSDGHTAAPAPNTAAPPRAARPRPARKGKVSICHATGSETNPYVLVTVSVNATTGNGHGRHEGDRPAVDGRCPAAAPGGPEGPGDPGPPPGHGEESVPPEDGGASSNSPIDGGSGVLVAQPTTPAAGVVGSDGGELPFTGLPLALLAILGAAACTIGLLLRRAGRRPEDGPAPASR